MTPAAAAGVPSSATQRTPRQAIEAQGGLVPNYNIFGQQHHREPHKDKSYLATVEERREWQREPKHRSRSEMLAARRAAKQPDISCDVDGDGAVGPTDYFIAKQFTRSEEPVRLNTAERDRVVDALESGYLDKYSFGHEQAGVNKCFNTYQKRGMIIMGDNQDDLNKVYPAHPRSSKEPRFRQGAEMRLARKADKINTNTALHAAWEKMHPTMVPEPPVQQESMVRDPEFTNISQRREAFRQAAREEAGLNPGTSVLNPEREGLELSTEHKDNPKIATRSALMATRKAQHIEDLQETRRRAQYDYVPHNARHAGLESEEYDKRRAPPDTMTLTKMKWQRKQEGIEYNMSNFKIKVEDDKGLPKYSDQEKPWWTMRDTYVEQPPACTLRALKEPEREMTMKVTAVVPPPPKVRTPAGSEASVKSYADRAGQNPHADPQLISEFGHKSIKRWTTEFVPPGLPSRVPRVFDGVVDGIKQASTFSGDTAPLHRFSSFEVIRKAGEEMDGLVQQVAAEEMEERAKQWKKYSTRGPDNEDSALALFGASNVGASPVTGQPSTAAASPAFQMPSGAASPWERRLTGAATPMRSRFGHNVPQIQPPHERPLGEDPPMTERLDRLSRQKALAAELAKTATNESPRGPQTARGLSPEPENGARRKSSRRNSSVGSGAAPHYAPSMNYPMTVRSGGFQWLNQQDTVVPPPPPVTMTMSAQPSVANVSMSRSSSRRSKARLP